MHSSARDIICNRYRWVMRGRYKVIPSIPCSRHRPHETTSPLPWLPCRWSCKGRVSVCLLLSWRSSISAEPQQQPLRLPHTTTVYGEVSYLLKVVAQYFQPAQLFQRLFCKKFRFFIHQVYKCNSVPSGGGQQLVTSTLECFTSIFENNPLKNMKIRYGRRAVV